MEGSLRQYGGRHPEDLDYWYGDERKPRIGHGFQEIDPTGEPPVDEPDLPQTGSYSTDDMMYGKMKSARVGNMRDLLDRKRQLANIDAEIKKLMAQRASLTQTMH